jgi:uncharacterized protein YhjY with autotransporter beta-barrel domain
MGNPNPGGLAGLTRNSLIGKLNEWSVTCRLFVGYRYSEVRRAVSGRAAGLTRNSLTSKLNEWSVTCRLFVGYRHRRRKR